MAYQQTVLRALADVESALADYRMQHEERQSLVNATKSSEQAFNRARNLYDSGLSDFINVLDSERTLKQVQDQLAVSETRLATKTVAVYKALGGGWKQPVH